MTSTVFLKKLRSQSAYPTIRLLNLLGASFLYIIAPLPFVGFFFDRPGPNLLLATVLSVAILFAARFFHEASNLVVDVADAALALAADVGARPWPSTPEVRGQDLRDAKPQNENQSHSALNPASDHSRLESRSNYTGPRDLEASAYRVFLAERFNVKRNDTLGGLQMGDQLFGTLEEALASAHQTYESQVEEMARAESKERSEEATRAATWQAISSARATSDRSKKKSKWE